MNSVNLIGNLTRDPELKYSPAGTAFLNCNVAVSRSFKNKNGEYESDFINFKAFGKTAELIADNFHRGSKIGLTGSIQTGKYQDRDDRTIYTTDVLVNNITFLEKKEQNSQGAASSSAGGNYSHQSDSLYDTMPDISDSDLPF